MSDFRPQDGPMLPRSVVLERRHQRRASRLKEQRDHWKAEYEKLRDFLASFPFYERERARRVEVLAQRDHLKNLETRCREQSMLIEELNKRTEP